MRWIFFSLLILPCIVFGKSPGQSPSEPALIVSNSEEAEGSLWEEDMVALSEVEAGAFEEHEKITPTPVISIDLKQVFKGSPIIYSLLIILSMTAVFLWLYTILRWRILAGYNAPFKSRLTDLLSTGKLNEARLLCQSRRDLLSKMVLASLFCKNTTPNEVEETIGQVVKRASSATWQRISILNDIAIIAPMLGLMGTVMGMFYAFYDINRSLNSITKLFDGLGISVATTVAGLIVAILSLLLHTFLKHRLIRRLSTLEMEANQLIPLLIHEEQP